MAKLLKSRNQYSSFNGVSSYIQYADNNIFSFTDGVNDIPFVIEFDLKLNTSSGFQVLLQKRSGASTNEWTVYLDSGKLVIILYSTTAAAYILKYTTSALTLNTQYNIKISYTGSKNVNDIIITLSNIIPATTTSTVNYIGMINTNATFIVGKSYTNVQYLNGYLRNLKITKNNQLVFQAPLQDVLNVSKDIISGLSGTVSNVSVVDINEGGNWAYFNGVNASAIIGTTSTFNFIHQTGIFHLSVDFMKLGTTASYQLIFGTQGTSSGTVNVGFSLYYNNTNLVVIIANGTVYNSVINIPLITANIIINLRV